MQVGYAERQGSLWTPKLRAVQSKWTHYSELLLGASPAPARLPSSKYPGQGFLPAPLLPTHACGSAPSPECASPIRGSCYPGTGGSHVSLAVPEKCLCGSKWSI